MLVTDYPRSAYGSNPLSGYNPNADNGWNPTWHYPAGVPASQMAIVEYRGVIMYVVAPLAEITLLSMRMAYEVYNYKLVPGWCWSYENRPIGGTDTPSNHSKGRAMDWNAPANGQGYTFQSDMPPAFVAAMCRLGWYWGGYYGGGSRYDPMHFEYVFSPDRVAQSVAMAKQILGVKPTPAPTPAKPKLAPWQLPKGVGYGRHGAKLPAGTKKTVDGTNTATSKANILRAQRALVRRGYKLGMIDGIFGAKTEAAVRAFQNTQKKKVKTTGVIGPVTWRLLEVYP